MITLLVCLAAIAILLLLAKRIEPTDRSAYRTGQLEQMQQADSFSDFLDHFFLYEVTSDSVTTAYSVESRHTFSIPELPALLTTFSLPDKQQQEHAAEILSLTTECLNRFSKDTLSAKEQQTYELLTRRLTHRRTQLSFPYYEELLGGTTGVQANLPVTLGEYPLRCKEDVRVYLALLRQIPSYFDRMIAYEKERSRLGYETPNFLLAGTKEKLTPLLSDLRADDNCFTQLFADRLRLIPGLTQKDQESFLAENKTLVRESVLPAYENLYHYVDQAITGVPLQEDTAYGLSSLPDGKAYYEALAWENSGSSHSVPELISMTDAALASTLHSVFRIMTTDEESYLYYCDHLLETPFESPASILEALSLLSRRSYPALQEVPDYCIKNVPDCLAASVSPAFYMLPAIDQTRSHTIYINPLYTNEQNGNLFTTLAHEGFPGHLYQTVYFQETKPHPIRQLLDYPGYVEGWATYVEMDSFSFIDYPKGYDSLEQLYQADTMINLCLSTRIDLGVNYENWTLKDVKNYFEENGFNSYYAEDVYTYVVEAPANYLRYFIGYLELCDLKEACKRRDLEHYTDLEFHRAILDFGPADYETLRHFLLTAS